MYFTSSHRVSLCSEIDFSLDFCSDCSCCMSCSCNFSVSCAEGFWEEVGPAVEVVFGTAISSGNMTGDVVEVVKASESMPIAESKCCRPDLPVGHLHSHLFSAVDCEISPEAALSVVGRCVMVAAVY